jgi:hypothetical protein
MLNKATFLTALEDACRDFSWFVLAEDRKYSNSSTGMPA